MAILGIAINLPKAYAVGFASTTNTSMLINLTYGLKALFCVAFLYQTLLNFLAYVALSGVARGKGGGSEIPRPVPTNLVLL